MTRMRLLLLLACLLPLSACSTYSLQNLRQTTPKGTPFQAALAVKYLEFSENEEKDYDWSSSWHFADKGLSAAYGNDVGPEYVEEWRIPASAQDELNVARARLMQALTDDAKANQPQDAADAVFFFDCWVEQQEEAWQEDDIAYCREHFQEALDAISGAPVPASAPAATVAERISYLVYFALGRTELDASAERTVGKVAEDLRQANDYAITLNGHTDRSGAAKTNMNLSRTRAERVKAALIARGIPASRIQTFGFGETDPRKATKEGVKEPANRRVEIFVN